MENFRHKESRIKLAMNQPAVHTWFIQNVAQLREEFSFNVSLLLKDYLGLEETEELVLLLLLHISDSV